MLVCLITGLQLRILGADLCTCSNAGELHTWYAAPVLLTRLARATIARVSYSDILGVLPRVTMIGLRSCTDKQGLFTRSASLRPRGWRAVRQPAASARSSQQQLPSNESGPVSGLVEPGLNPRLVILPTPLINLQVLIWSLILLRFLTSCVIPLSVSSRVLRVVRGPLLKVKLFWLISCTIFRAVGCARKYISGLVIPEL